MSSSAVRCLRADRELSIYFGQATKLAARRDSITFYTAALSIVATMLVLASPMFLAFISPIWGVLFYKYLQASHKYERACEQTWASLTDLHEAVEYVIICEDLEKDAALPAEGNIQ